jgi:ABC-type sugar transport system ATPase subunit
MAPTRPAAAAVPAASVPAASVPAASVPAVSMKGITKRFPGVVANDHVDFEATAGEVHALLGENGAGKTTLSQILSGLYHADEGEIRLFGNPVAFSSPRDAIDAGVCMVHQHFRLVDRFTVAENLVLGDRRGAGRRFRIRPDAVEHQVRELGERYRLPVDPRARIWQLSVGEQQRVEILKALYQDARVLILDEPTAVLTPDEADMLFATLRDIAAEGRTVVFISHKLNEVEAVSDRVTVLRAGRKVTTVRTAEGTQQLPIISSTVEYTKWVGTERRFSIADIDAFSHTAMREPGTSRELLYARVSGTTGQETSLAAQEAELRATSKGPVVAVVKDRASGLRENRPGLAKALKMAAEGKCDVVRVTHEDRLARFGAKWVTDLFARDGVKVEVLHQKSQGGGMEELLSDFMSLVATFAGRMYGIRSREAKERLLNAAKEHVKDDNSVPAA